MVRHRVFTFKPKLSTKGSKKGPKKGSKSAK